MSIWLLGLLMAADAIPLVGLLIPGDIAVVTAAASRGLGGLPGSIAAVVLGTLVTWSAFFWLGRLTSDRLRRSRFGRWIGARRWDAAEAMLRDGRSRVLMLVQFLPVLNTIIPMVAGGLKMSYRRFIVYAAIGSTGWATLYSTIGAVARTVGDAWLDTGNPLVSLALFGIPGLLVGWTVLAVVRRAIRLPSPVAVPQQSTPPPLEVIVTDDPEPVRTPVWAGCGRHAA